MPLILHPNISIGTPRHHTEGWLEIAKGKQRGQRGITSMTKNDRQKGEEVMASPGKAPVQAGVNIRKNYKGHKRIHMGITAGSFL